MHISYEELLAQTRKALTNDKTAAVGFIYEVSSVGKNVRRFTWKRYEEAEDIKVIRQARHHQNRCDNFAIKYELTAIMSVKE